MNLSYLKCSFLLWSEDEGRAPVLPSSVAQTHGLSYLRRLSVSGIILVIQFDMIPQADVAAQIRVDELKQVH